MSTFRSSHRRSAALVAAMVAAASVSVIATDVSDLPIEKVGEFHSQPGEQLEPFLLRVGAALHAFSARTQFEACGWVGASADRGQFAVVAFTNRSHIACNSRGADVRADMTPLQFTIHSHPTQDGLLANREDKLALHLVGNGSAVRGLTRSASTAATVKVETDGFSAGDYVRPGYLAARGGLWFQDGVGTDRFVGAYPAVQP